MNLRKNMFFPVDSIQIQTIDSCNASCIHCPYSETKHTDTPMIGSLFTKIISQITDRIKEGDIIKSPKIYLFAQNEPLLDVHIFEKIMYIKKEIPEASIILATNALLLPNLKEKIPKLEINELYIFLYSHDHRSFADYTGIPINKDQYDKIIKAIDHIKRKTPGKVVIMDAWVYDENSGKREFLSHCSPSGLYTDQIRHKEIIGCRKRKHEGWLTIDAQGNLYLCSMDWRKETIYGNINNTSLANIWKSQDFLNLVHKTHGNSTSVQKFICKKCEWAIPKSKKNKKALIFTSASSEMSLFLTEWIISLRIIGGYTGEILVLDYGLDERVKHALSSFTIEFTPCVRRSSLNALIVITRYIDILRIIKEKKLRNYSIAHFDVDIWFQENVNPLFDLAETLEGCLFSTEYSLLKLPYRGPLDSSMRSSFMEKSERILNQYGGYINGGFLFGRVEAIIKKLEKLRQLIADIFVRTDWGVDQFLLNYLFDFNQDRADGYKWNCVLSNAVFKENAWYTPGFYDFPQEKAAGVHCFGAHKPIHRNDKMKRFYYLYNDIFKKNLSQIGITMDMLIELSATPQKK